MRFSPGCLCCAPPFECEYCADGLLPDCIYVRFLNFYVDICGECGSCVTLDDYCQCMWGAGGVVTGTTVTDPAGELTGSVTGRVVDSCFPREIPGWFESVYNSFTRQNCKWIGWMAHPTCQWYITMEMFLVYEGGNYILRMNVVHARVGVCEEFITYEKNFGVNKPECRHLNHTLTLVSFSGTACCVDEEDNPLNLGSSVSVQSCAACDCAVEDPALEFQVQLAITDPGSSGPDCADEDCSGFSGIFQVLRVSEEDCTRRYDFPASVCSPESPTDYITLELSGNASRIKVRITLYWYCLDALQTMVWEDTYDGIECQFPSWTPVSFVGQSGGGTCCLGGGEAQFRKAP